jgi:hypothetical protein
MASVYITIHDSSKDEERMVAAIREVLRTYKVPVETHTIIVEKGAIPHSHPVLTMNARTTDPLRLLELLTHEQLHWFFENQPNDVKAYAIAELKRKYPDVGDVHTQGNEPDTFWEHLIVIWNVLNCLQQQLKQDEIGQIFTGWRPYPKTEQFVRDHFAELQADLARLSMVYDTAKMQRLDENT